MGYHIFYNSIENDKITCYKNKACYSGVYRSLTKDSSLELFLFCEQSSWKLFKPGGYVISLHVSEKQIYQYLDIWNNCGLLTTIEKVDYEFENDDIKHNKKCYKITILKENSIVGKKLLINLIRFLFEDDRNKFIKKSITLFFKLFRYHGKKEHPFTLLNAAFYSNNFYDYSFTNHHYMSQLYSIPFYNEELWKKNIIDNNKNDDLNAIFPKLIKSPTPLINLTNKTLINEYQKYK